MSVCLFTSNGDGSTQFAGRLADTLKQWLTIGVYVTRCHSYDP